MKPLLLAALLATAALPSHAGGPVLVEDATEDAPVARDRDSKLPLILFGLAVGALILSGGGSDCTCNTPDPDPETPGSCGC